MTLFRRVSAFHGIASASHPQQLPASAPTTLSCSSALSNARRFARPTFAEITEDLNVLGATLDMSAADLKKKYRELVRTHHPDAGGDEKTMSKITVAYDRLSGLSNREKEEFKAQRNAYRGGSGNFGRSGAAAGMYSQQAQRTYAGSYQRPAYGQQSTAGADHGWGQEGADFSREYARANARATYNYNSRNPGAYSENPFRNHDTVNLNQAFKHFLRMPLNSLMVRGLLLYIVISMVFAIVYRRYRDWRHEEGWKASESLARHEQLERLHQLRQELQDRVDRSRDGRNTKRWEDFEKAKELRVQEYAQRRQLDAQAQEAELSSWPRFDDTQGSLVKRPYDPPGITYFEPGAANERKRQISLSYGETQRERMRRELELAEATATAAAEAANNNNNSAAAVPPAGGSSAMMNGKSSSGPIIVSTGADGSYQMVTPPTQPRSSMSSLPPESSSGVRAYVSSREITPQEQNTLHDVIHTILRGPNGAPAR